MRRIKIIFALTCAMLLTSCQGITFSLDDLLSAPKVADEQSAIYQALLESAGHGITLEYPRNGDYRSAFVLYDIDGDGDEETLAFYSVSAQTDSNVKISVLDREADGKWRAQSELAGAGGSVDTVMFSGTDMVVGYSAQDYEEKAVRMYRYSGKTLEPIYEGTYSLLEMADTDGCGREEISVVRRSGLGIEVEILKTQPDGGYTVYGIQLEESASAISACSFGEYKSAQAMYLDISTDSGGLITEVMYLDGDIVCPTASEGLTLRTQRPAGYYCMDYDNDGKVEIPSLTPFTGYESAPWGEGEYLTTWLSLTEPQTESEAWELETKSYSYTNLRDGYILTIPNRWQNVVTVTRDQGTGIVTFCSYSLVQDSGSDAVSVVSEPIMSFAAADELNVETYIQEGYEVLYETEQKTYFVKTVARDETPLILTMDEIRNNFYII